MAHWFHRNVFKATAPVNFDLKLIAMDGEALKICSDLKQSRARLIQLFPDANHAPETVDVAFNQYMAIFIGFLTAPDSKNTGVESKMRYSVLFKWTHTLLGNKPQLMRDSYFEGANMSYNVAIWYMKHAAMLAGKDDITMEEAKEVHKCLRKAAGIFRFIQSQYLPQLPGKQLEGGDLDPRVLSAYLTQCTAEAQEVTVARAVELKHNPSLISALSNETSKMFADAATVLATVEQAKQWVLYLKIKAAFYEAYAYTFCGENLLSQDKCGEAVRGLQEGQTSYKRAIELSKEYAKTKGPAPKVQPETHASFRRLSPLLNRTLEKCVRENGFIYHQKVPADPPELEHKATYGLASPEEFSMPSPCPLWNPASYAAFDDSKNAAANDPTTSSNTAAKLEGELPAVKEAQVHQSSKDPKTESGCSIQ
ncbi:LOW QUALITY PROTEIN: BRO1 domain-containing protein BROX-like [Schistocerca piceifrons]|uniref:LOW QUALITY PROTEIN: BRO1 domain-containing protein BROX-like n=1 Tax=Schistocerca piceifrons TaxID=274613 RepID=UPI001F5EB6D0|nr:LOW QUALITY PROTEIN: BRO1 domain-containing protein BROX-like [Schistocerca piceifrons]